MGKTVGEIVGEAFERRGVEIPSEFEKRFRGRIREIIRSFRDAEKTDSTVAEILVALVTDPQLQVMELPWHWLVFTDPDLPPEEGFIGVLVTRALSVEMGALMAYLNGIVTEGEVDGAALPVGLSLNPCLCERLLSKEEADILRRELDLHYH